MTEVQWRRRWKPDLQTQAWRIVKGLDGLDEGQSVMLKWLFTDSSYELLVTNQEKLWYHEASGEEILKRSKKLNPSVEVPLDKLLDHIKNQMEGESANLTFKKQDDDDDSVTLTLKTNLAGLPFTWKFSCHLDESENLRRQFSTPLLSMVEELLRREKELMKILKAKDTEIADLKAQGVKTSRKHLETGLFVPTAFANSMATSKEFEKSVKSRGSKAFQEDGQQLYKDVMMKSAWLNRDLEDDIDEDAGGDEAGESWNQKVPPSLATAGSPMKSPLKSPAKSPAKASSSADSTPTKDAELMRREALQKRLLEEQERKDASKKKKKKLKL